MEYEDTRSFHYREYQAEQIREEKERENMYNEEQEQCEVDKFWGIELFEKNLLQEERRLREFYAQRVKTLNQELVKMKVVQNVSYDSYKSYIIPEQKYQQEDMRRRVKLQQRMKKDEQLAKIEFVKQLKAEEIRSKLKYRLPTKFY